MTEGGEHAELLRKRRIPVGGNGAGVWSLVHIDDAAAATVAAIESGTPGIFNVVDDAPAPAAEVLPGLAAAFGAPPPRHVPGWLVRLAAGGQAHSMMTRIRGASNEKAKRELGWQPTHTWKDIGRRSPVTGAGMGGRSPVTGARMATDEVKVPAGRRHGLIRRVRYQSPSTRKAFQNARLACSSSSASSMSACTARRSRRQRLDLARRRDDLARQRQLRAR